MAEYVISVLKFATGAKHPKNYRKLVDIREFLSGQSTQSYTGTLTYAEGRTARHMVFACLLVGDEVFVRPVGDDSALYNLKQQGRKLLLSDGTES